MSYLLLQCWMLTLSMAEVLNNEDSICARHFREPIAAVLALSLSWYPYYGNLKHKALSMWTEAHPLPERQPIRGNLA